MNRDIYIYINSRVPVEAGEYIIKEYTGHFLVADYFEYNPDTDQDELIREARITLKELAEELKHVDGRLHQVIWLDPDDEEDEDDD